MEHRIPDFIICDIEFLAVEKGLEYNDIVDEMTRHYKISVGVIDEALKILGLQERFDLTRLIDDDII